ncbi:serine hydrolase [Nannocystis sp. ILAH1]|uniref:serine hydrolase domain-containing protein n=1 Tax=unclassified Nannocystis TaxID=2627009 RepID=UPI0022710863|nr:MULTISPECIES: serine hydrolase [unclassified Nannocystis]MCY0990950.1 serine hydrolase [Nannocystis sp. ILAH1]MCY1064452.1 serine hydrolase [Nannocystis sp. RBIL2]
MRISKNVITTASVALFSCALVPMFACDPDAAGEADADDAGPAAAEPTAPALEIGDLREPTKPSRSVPQTLPSVINLDSYLADLTPPSASPETSGMLVAVVRGNHIAAFGRSGFNKYNTDVIDDDSVFNIGSNSKNMTVLALSYLIEQNSTLEWDTPLWEAAPFVTTWHSTTLTDEATLRSLVAHRAGFNDTGCNVAWPSGWQNLNSQTALRAKAIHFAGSAACTDGSVGVEDYSNVGFHFAQAIVEYWTNQPLKNYVKSQFVDPWDMDASFLWTRPPELARSPSGFSGTPAQQAVWEQYFSFSTHPLLSTGHYMWSSGATLTPYTLADPNTDPYGLYTGAGNMAINMQDWARYATQMMRNRNAAVRPIREAAMTSTWDYEYGWHIAQGSTTGFEWSSMDHGGALPLDGSHARSRIVLFPQHDTAYLFYANGGPDPSGAIDEAYNDIRVSAVPPGGDDGCARSADVKSIQRFYDQTMFGCAGSVTFANRENLCATGFHTCSALEYHNKNAAANEMPLYHYWTDDALDRSASGGTNNCSAFPQGSGTACGGSAAPMRVCTDTQTDLLGNTCNWLKCGWQDTTNEWFGGCAINTSENWAGTLCCED